jgi:hypothetical protein
MSAHAMRMGYLGRHVRELRKSDALAPPPSPLTPEQQAVRRQEALDDVLRNLGGRPSYAKEHPYPQADRGERYDPHTVHPLNRPNGRS